MARYKKITAEDINYFQKLCGENYILFREKTNMSCISEQRTKESIVQQVVVEPNSLEIFTGIMEYAYEKNIPITFQSEEIGLVDGIVISKINAHKNLELDEEKLTLWFR